MRDVTTAHCGGREYTCCVHNCFMESSTNKRTTSGNGGTDMKLRFTALLASGVYAFYANQTLAAEHNPTLPACTFKSLCLGKTNSKAEPIENILIREKVVTFTPEQDKNLYYVRIKIDCNSAGLRAFAQQYTNGAWNLGLLRQDREQALSVDVEKVSGGAKAATKIATYVIGQIKRDGNGATTVEACDDVIATDLPFNNTFRLKFKILQSKQTKVTDGFYASFRFVARFIGFVVGGGPTGAPIVAAVNSASQKVTEGKSDIDTLAAMFDEVNTQTPQFLLENNVKSITFKLRGGEALKFERVATRSNFLRFDGEKIKNPGDSFENLIADDPGLDLKKYLEAGAAEWDTLLLSDDAKTAAKGCIKLRTALRAAFTSEESVALVATKLSNFGSAAIANLKEPCLKPLERKWLTDSGIGDPLPAKGSDVTPGSTPAPTPSQPDDLKWAKIKSFLSEFGRVLVNYGITPQPKRDSRKLVAYLDKRVATQSFDLANLLPSSNGVLAETLAEKIATTWPFGQGVRFGCFIKADTSLTDKFAAQMLVQLDADSPNSLLVNLIIGFADPKLTDADNLQIGNIIIEKSTASSLNDYQKAYAKGCGDKSDPWKPWEKAGA